MKSAIAHLIVLSIACTSSIYATTNSFSNLVLSYGDFERCSFGICRNEEKTTTFIPKHAHSVRVIKKATGGGQRKRTRPSHALVRDDLNDGDRINKSSGVSSVHLSRRWGMF